MEMLPISKDTVQGPNLMNNLALGILVGKWAGPDI
jgi:hypothetical protein